VHLDRNPGPLSFRDSNVAHIIITQPRGITWAARPSHVRRKGYSRNFAARVKTKNKIKTLLTELNSEQTQIKEENGRISIFILSSFFFFFFFFFFCCNCEIFLQSPLELPSPSRAIPSANDASFWRFNFTTVSANRRVSSSVFPSGTSTA